MTLILSVLHVMVCISLVTVVLLQRGSTDMGAAFGGSSQSVFGAQGSGNFLSKLTAVLAAVFMLTSLTLAFFSTRSVDRSVMEDGVVTTDTAKPNATDGNLDTDVDFPALPEEAGAPDAAAPAMSNEDKAPPVPGMETVTESPSTSSEGETAPPIPASSGEAAAGGPADAGDNKAIPVPAENEGASSASEPPPIPKAE